MITEPKCFWNCLVSVRKASRGSPNPLPNCFGNNISIAARGAEQEGRNPAQGSRGFGAPGGPRNLTPRFTNSGTGKPLPRGPLEPRKGSQGLGGGSSGASERCVRFQRSGERRWATQRPLRGPVFPDAPLRGFQPSGSYPQATDKHSAISGNYRTETALELIW